MAHRGDQAPHGDRVPGRIGGLLTVREPGQHGVDHLVERQAAVDVQFRREAHLGVDDGVRGQIFRTFERDAV